MKKRVTAILLSIFTLFLLLLQEGASLKCYECLTLNETDTCDDVLMKKEICADDENACVFVIGHGDHQAGQFRGCYKILDPDNPPHCQKYSVTIQTKEHGNVTVAGNVCVCTSDLCNNEFIPSLMCFQCDTFTNPRGCNVAPYETCNATSHSCFSATGLINSKNETIKGCSDKEVEGAQCQSGNFEETYKGELYNITGTECLCDTSFCNNQSVTSTTTKSSRSTSKKSTATTVARKITTGNTCTVSHSLFVVVINIFLFVIVALNH